MFLIGGINISKEIPKRDGQKFNGVFPSVFALAFLMVGVPLLSTAIVSGSLWFGDSSKYVSSYSKNDVVLGEGDYPFWVQSGDGPDSKCLNPGQNTNPQPNCSANLTNAYSIIQLLDAANNGTKWHHGLPHCSNNAVTSDCGDSGYIVTQNITSRLEIDRIFPSIYFAFTNDVTQVYDKSRMGNSKVDFTITISHYMRDPLFSGTNIWTYGYLEKEISFSGTHDFKNYVDVNETHSIIQIEVEYTLDFVDLDKLSQIVDDYYNSNNESFGLFMTIEMNNLRTSQGYAWSNVGWHNPFTIGADGNHEMYLDFIQLKVDPFNIFLKFGVFAMGGGFWLIALASTPYWNPFIKKVSQ